MDVTLLVRTPGSETPIHEKERGFMVLSHGGYVRNWLKL